MSNVIVFPTATNVEVTTKKTEEVNRIKDLILPGTGFGVDVSNCKNSSEVLDTAGLNWEVYLEQNRGARGNLIENSYTLYRDLDDTPVGINLTKRYVPLQNEETVRFADYLLDEGFQFMRAGAFYGGSRVWVMGKFPDKSRDIMGDPFDQYMVISNSHDKSSSFRVGIVPIRIACSNALNIAFKKATFYWGIRHNSEMMWKLDDAKRSVAMATGYMDALEEEMKRLNKIILSPTEVKEFTEALFPIDMDADPTPRIIANAEARRAAVNDLFYHKDDLMEMPSTAYRFVNAVSDYATHKKQSENHFINTIDGLKEVRDAYNFFAA